MLASIAHCTARSVFRARIMDGHSPPNGDAFAQKILRRNPSEQYCFLNVRDVAARSVPAASAQNIWNESGCLPYAKSSEAGFEYIVTSAPSPSCQARFWIKSRTSPSVYAPIL